MLVFGVWCLFSVPGSVRDLPPRAVMKEFSRMYVGSFVELVVLISL
jgi:hypothetical protein